MNPFTTLCFSLKTVVSLHLTFQTSKQTFIHFVRWHTSYVELEGFTFSLHTTLDFSHPFAECKTH
jgi:hypothetical protein